MEPVQNLIQEATTQQQWTSYLQQKYDNIDSKVTEIMLRAEEISIPKYKTTRQWSVNLRTYGTQLRYYNRYKKFQEGQYVPQSTLKKLASQADIIHKVLTKEEVRSHLHDTKIKFQQVKREHAQQRTNFLHQLALEYSDKGLDASQGIIHSIMEREQLKKTHAHIRHALQKGKKSSLLRLIVPQNTSPPTSKIYTSKEEIHHEIIQYNIKHYSKAEQSPVGIGTPLYDKLGPHGNTPFCDQVLQGNKKNRRLERYTSKRNS